MPMSLPPRHTEWGRLRVYRSMVVERGSMIVMGGRAHMPEDWKSMTWHQQLRWAVSHASAIVLNPTEELPKMHEVMGH